MQIQFDEKQIAAALDTAATVAITSAFSGYASASALRDIVSKSVLPEIMTKALTEAASRVDLEALTSSLATQIARTITSAAVMLIRDSTVEMILDLRKIPSYDDEKRNKARVQVMCDLAGHPVVERQEADDVPL